MLTNKRLCKNCANWYMEDGDTHPYCLMKDFYTHTDGEQECDEKTYRGDFYYTPYKAEDEEP